MHICLIDPEIFVNFRSAQYGVALVSVSPRGQVQVA